jgi:hypothetical protein
VSRAEGGPSIDAAAQQTHLSAMDNVGCLPHAFVIVLAIVVVLLILP